MDIIDSIRAFNRLWTLRMGLLGRSYLDSGLSVTEARVLYDLAEPGDHTATVLAQGLGLDEGQLSRLIARFRAAGLVTRRVAAGDRRQRPLALTDKGRALALDLRQRSRADVAQRLAALPADAPDRIGGALSTLTATLDPPRPDDITLRDLAPGDLGWVTMQHGRLYARDEGYDIGFEALVARILADMADRPDGGRAFVAVAGQERLGCVFVAREDDKTARLRLLLLLPEARGLGLGRRMLDAATDFARASGYRRMVLWTHESHRAAVALYRRAGWQMVSSQPARAFGQDVVDQHWERPL